MANMSFSGGGDPVSLFTGTDRKFHDPFLLPSNQTLPTELDSALDFCLYLYYMNPQYRRASIRIISHFVTDIEFEGETGDEKERDNLYDFLTHQLDVFGMMLELGEEWACFAGETKVVTRGGVYPIVDLAGKTVDVLSKDGVYRPAEFSSFGVQPLMEVSFHDGRKIYATPEHKWEVRNGRGEIVEVTTRKLRPKSHRIKRTVAPRPEKNDDYYEGIRHGFIYGDGNLNNVRDPKRKQSSTASFYGDKDAAMEPYFAEHHNPIIPRKDRDCRRQHGHPGHWKELPAAEASASYWYGFVSGFFAADGCVDRRDGCAVLVQECKRPLQAIIDQLPRIGMVAGELREYDCETTPPGRKTPNKNRMAYVNLLKQFMQPDDFLIPKHREYFEKHRKPNSKYGQWMRIKAVTETDRVEEVYCCVEPDTHRFVVSNGVLTSNCYGNGFSRIHFPTDRFLVDNQNPGVHYSLDAYNTEDIKYLWREMKYEVPDLKTAHLPSKQRKTVKLSFFDQPSKDLSRIRLRKLDPRYVTLRHSFISGRTTVIYKFDPEFLSQLKKGMPWQANETPVPMLKAIASEQDFEFHEGRVYHVKAPTVSGVSNFGWGIPEVIANYRSLHQLQVYRKIDESVGLDYMLPFRVFSPELGNVAQDGLKQMISTKWRSNVDELIKRRRADPFAMHAFPFPINYQEFGAEGKQLAPKDLIEFQTNDMLDAMGYPAELHRGTLAVQQIPTTLRMFENSFHFLHRHFDNYLKWVTRQVLDYLGSEQIGVKLQLPRMADDLEARHIYLQLAAGAEIPREIAYKPFGIDDPVEAVKRRMQEDIEVQKEQAKLQADFEREQTLGSMDAILGAQAEAQSGEQAQGGAAPTGAEAAGGTTPLDIQQQAEQKAMQLVQEDAGVVQRELANLKTSNPTLHALVKEMMDQIRRDAESQGRASLKGGGQQA